MDVFNMMNPVRGRPPSRLQRLQVDPTPCRRVYSEHRMPSGGWTWYTGSAGWLYRTGLEWILGFKLRDSRLTLSPCVPTDWDGFSIQFRYKTSNYEIIVDKQPSTDARPQFTVDGEVQSPGGNVVDMIDDGARHTINVAWQAARAAEDSAATQSS